MNVFRSLKEHYRKERKLIVLTIACLLLSTALGLVYPNLLRYLIDDVIMQRQFDQVPTLALLVISVTAVKAAFTFAYGHFGGRAGNRIAYNLRNAAYRKLQALSFSYYDKAKTGDLMSRLTGDLEAVRHFFGYELPHMFNFCASILFGAAVMMTISWKLTLIVLVTMPLLVVLAVKFQSRVQPALRSIRQSISQLTSAAQENISGVRTVKSFSREPYEVAKFGKHSEGYKEINISTATILSNYIPAMEWTVNLSLVILMGAGGYLVLRDQLSLGDLVAFFSLVGYIIGPLWHVGYHINVYAQTKASAERVVEVLQHFVQIKDAPDAGPLPNSTSGGHHVVFDNVSFAYGEKAPALTQIDIDARPGAVIGILGGTGSGKSTLIQLLMRAYNVSEGRISLDGRDIRDVRLEDLRSGMAFVFQETFLFSSTIRNNIAYGLLEASQEQIEEAARLAQAHDFIMELPEGYDTVVGERGLGLSGGQKQRIAIARALIKRPKLLVLDDATSAVDMETELRIQQGIRSLQGSTVFIIAHRISSLQHADEIVVLEEGRIVERGSHSSLLAAGGRYAQTYRIQHEASEDTGIGAAGIVKDGSIPDGGTMQASYGSGDFDGARKPGADERRVVVYE